MHQLESSTIAALAALSPNFIHSIRQRFSEAA